MTAFDVTVTESFDYRANAELFTSRGRKAGQRPVGYRRFKCAADAIRFAIEDLPPNRLVGACLEVDEVRFDGCEIRELYDNTRYPHARRTPSRGE